MGPGHDCPDRFQRVEEIGDGLAQYTGTVLTATSHVEGVASALEQLTAAEQHETFLQQAYMTGVAYGILLDAASADWRRRVRSDSVHTLHIVLGVPKL